jgi:ubiquinone/menaquinone biosynthesis C-methylase UbiE
MGMSTAHEPYLKASGSDRLAPFYDAHVRLLMRERYIKRRVIERAELKPGQRLLDVGCGTGTLVLMARRMHPKSTIVGLDGDPVILAIARRKAAKERLSVQLDEGMAYAMPYPDRSFDAVVSSLMLHHLTHDQQLRCLAEMKRVLVPGGRLVIADFAPPHNRLMKLARFPARLLFRAHTRGRGHGEEGHHGHAAAENAAPARQRRRFDQGLIALGWERVTRPQYFNTLVGTLALYTAVCPGGTRAEAEAAVEQHGV